METAVLNSEQLISSSHTVLSSQELLQVHKKIFSHVGTGGIKNATIVAIQATLLNCANSRQLNASNVENSVTFSMSAEASRLQNPLTLFACSVHEEKGLYNLLKVESGNDRVPPIMIEMDINRQ